MLLSRHSVMSDSLRPHGLKPTNLFCPWSSPGKNAGVGCHFLLQHSVVTDNPSQSRLDPLEPCVCVLSRFSRVQLFATLWAVAHQAPLSRGFSRQQYWSGLPCPPPGDLPHPGIKPTYPAASALQVDSSLLSHRGNPIGATDVLNC